VNSASGNGLARTLVLGEREFNRIRDIVYNVCRINLGDSKKSLVHARLSKRVRMLGLKSYREYLNLVESDPSGRELGTMIDMLTTNLTFFFREADHFRYLMQEFLPKVKAYRFRAWSAGCSSGEEAYTLAMVLREAWPDLDERDVVILATDISMRVIEIARSGIYPESRFKDTPKAWIAKYFEKVATDSGYAYKTRRQIRDLVRFRILNLVDSWPMKGHFDLVMCRNVMIYFDRPTQEEIVERFFNIIRPGGIFIVGHSEGLTGMKHQFKMVRPSIYVKI